MRTRPRSLLALVLTTAVLVAWAVRTDPQLHLAAPQLPTTSDAPPATGDAPGDDPAPDRPDDATQAALALLEGLLGPDALAGAACLVPDPADLATTDPSEGPSDASSASPEDVVATVTAQVATLRELPAPEVEVAFLDDAEVAADLDRLLSADVDPTADADRAAVLAALRVLPPATDLDALRRGLLDDQAAGYYVTDERRLVVRRSGDGPPSPLDRIVLAHELTHAAADAALGLPDLAALDTDAALAALAVVEGDATLLMQRWSQRHLGLLEQLSLLGGVDVAAQVAGLAEVPHHLQRELLFPYTVGLDLVCDLERAGGWPAVDAAYADPPTTTAAALWPERGTARPAPLDPPPVPDDAEVRTDTFGAAELRWLFEAPGDDPGAALDGPLPRAAAWDGGEVHVVDDGEVVALRLRDGGTATATLCDSVRAWATAAVGPPTRRGADTVHADAVGVVAVACVDDRVHLGAADDADAALAVTR